MGTVLNSLDTLLAQYIDKGPLIRTHQEQVSGTTAATTTSGYTSAQRCAATVTIPTLGSGVTGVCFPVIKMTGEDAGCIHIATLEYELGSLAVSTNTFTGGSAMPTKIVRGESVLTASIMPMLIVDTSLTATAPVVTITYTNQSGTGSRTCTMTLPNSPLAKTAFFMGPHLQSGDTGVRSVQNISISTGSAGTLKVMGNLILSYGMQVGTTINVDPLTLPIPHYRAIAGDRVAFYRTGNSSSWFSMNYFVAVADN